MKRVTALTLFLMVCFAGGHPGNRVHASTEQGILVKLQNSATSPSGWEPILPRANIFRVMVPADRLREELEGFRSRPDVQFAEVDETVEAFFTPNDPQFSTQWHFEKIGLADAWEHDATAPLYGGDPSVVVAVIDTGIAYESYTDNGTVYGKSPDFSSTSFVAGYDFVNDDVHPNDDNGHGTHVAATIAETTNNGVAGAGIAFNSSLMPLKVLNRLGSGSVSDVALAINFAVENGADIINLSLGSSSTTQTLVTAVQDALNANIVLVAAAGNDAQGSLGFPAAYPGVIAVSALGRDDLLASYSNYGEGLSISAPGGDDAEFVWQQSYSSLDENRLPLDYTTFDIVGYQGTSQAAPHVAGSAALLLARGVPGNGVKTLLEQSATDLGSGSGYDLQNGYGRVNVAAALNAFVNDVAAPVTSVSISPSTPNGNDGYYKTKPEITLSATDAAAGSGVRTIYYRWGSEEYSAYTLPIEPPDGVSTLSYYAIDISGNSEIPQSRDFLVDSEPPVITVTRPAGVTARTEFVVSGSVTDATSAIRSFTVNAKDVFVGENHTFLTTLSAPIGEFTVTLVARDGAGSTTTLVKRFTIENGEYFFATPGKGSGPQVLVLKKNRTIVSSFFAFAKNFRGGVSIASLDMNGDGLEEIVTAPENGSGPQVRIFSKNGKLLSQFFAFSSSTRHGLQVATGDVNGDGKKEILASPTLNATPMIRIFSPKGTLQHAFRAFPKSFRGGVSLASCDINSDRRAEVIASPGAGSEPLVRVYTKSGKLLYQFLAYESSFSGGVNVSCGDINGDGKNEILTTPGKGRTVDVRVFSKSGKRLYGFRAYKTSYIGGAKITAGDVNGDNKKDIVVSPSSAGVSEVRSFTKRGTILAKFAAFPPTVTSTNIATGFAFE